MITTITLNPSVDRRYVVEGFEVGKVFRTSTFEATAGGKGLNVTRVAHLLGADIFATGLIGGKSGEFIERKLTDSGIPHHFQQIKGETRTCIAILSELNEQTEILEPGPKVDNSEIDSFLGLFDDLLEKSSVITASGSLMKGMPTSLYAMLIEKARLKNVPFLLDTSGKPLIDGINACPTFIKPNREELEGIIGTSLECEGDIIRAAKVLAGDKVETVMVSLGGDGAIVHHRGKDFRVHIPEVLVKNPVGSGDSTVAGFAVGLDRGYSFLDSIRLAVSCGTANAMEEETGHINKQKVEWLMQQVKIE